ncbi:MAG: carbamate kinase [Solirubrobacteraceae bacterium]|jgi:carbamate kinase|nr:carbamate kinase [Solirubrobacteraceae bacterium]
MRIVIAVGGNALLKEDQRGTWADQLESARPVAEAVVALRREGHEVVLTHGNGPQVGTLMLQHAMGEPQVPALPLHALGAMTQGDLGYLLQMSISEIDPGVPSATILTRVRVADDDPAFDNPTKPVGPFYSEADARRLSRDRGWVVGEDSGRGWRCMVASPRPVEILELEQIRVLAESGSVVIAGGGGGIPVSTRDGTLAGMAAVIDKDRCSAELGLALGFDLLVLLTAVPRVVVDFGTRWERPLWHMSVAETRRLLAAGEFPPGSMGPKIESAERFATGGGRAAIITDAASLMAAIHGEDGTWIQAEQEAVLL